MGKEINFIACNDDLGSSFIAGMDKAMAEYAKKKGLIDHMYFYNLPQGLSAICADFPQVLEKLKALPAGLYFTVIHPSCETEERRKTGNAHYSGEEIAKSRAYETQIFSDITTMKKLKEFGYQGIRYDEAVPQTRKSLP
ncbi:hypothetical protein M2150_001528 [Lachnospiraceae bacterium PM6-15]|uniref:hypothetical protein n=1 Tax=Ohessyouella blattaphilus TaxID=2949333 RepID=UPI003E1AD070